MTAVTVRALTKAFGPAQVLRGIDLVVADEGVTAILGPSGCGKTTLLRLIAGFDSPDSGEIALGEQVVCGGGRFVAPQHRRVGYVPQEGALFPHLDVAGNITFGLRGRERRRGRSGGGRGGQRVDELLALVGLDPAVRQRFPHQLSGGQQQRVALARALAPRPSLILLDEPFSSLDAGLREGTGRAVVRALKATSTTALLVTHDQSEALSLADQVAVMRDGTLAQVGTPHEVYREPADLGVAQFVGAAVIVDTDVVDGSASSDLGPLRVSAGFGSGRARLLVRPEQIELDVPPKAGVAANVVSGVGPAGVSGVGPAGVSGVALDGVARAATGSGVKARVVDVSYFGHDASVRLEVLTSGRVVTARVLGLNVPMPDAVVTLSVKGPVAAYGPQD
jgi:iron(III) transport system ATP-binding protein